MTPKSDRHSANEAARDVARALVRRYPQPWRVRYEEEVLALLDDTSVRWFDILDLTRGLLVERARALVEPGDRPRLTVFLIGVMPTLISLLACGLGSIGRVTLGALPAWAGVAAAFMLVALSFGVTAQWFVYVLRHPEYLTERYPQLSLLPSRWVAVARVCFVVAAWAGMPFFTLASMTSTFLFVYGPGSLVRNQPGGRWSQAQTALRQLQVATGQLKWASMELDRCRQLHAQGLPAPLREAEIVVAELQQSQAEALAALHSIGYRASFRPRLSDEGAGSVA